MSAAELMCEDELRRHDVRLEGYNGFDYVEVDLAKGTLTVFLLAKLADPAALTPRHFVVTGGRRVRDVRITKVAPCAPPDPRIDDCLVLTFNHPGDHSAYTLCIVELDADGRPTEDPYPGFDPRYACLDFTFKVDCPSDLDCLPGAVCPPEPRFEPEINYLAKDYAGFRQVILDRLAAIMPDWKERHAPDLGIALVELLAYTGDYLSYYQDAVATEAYLDTARQRVSVRRHARLVDYLLHEGTNARAWLCVEVDAARLELDPDDVTFITRQPGLAGTLSEAEVGQSAQAGGYETFSPLLPPGEADTCHYRVLREDASKPWLSEPQSPAAKIVLRAAHNRISFYTWGDEACCLPRGTTSAWLWDEGAQRKQPDGGKPRDAKQQAPAGQQQQAPVQQQGPGPVGGPDDFDYTLELEPGDFLVFEEVLGPKTGVSADADPAHRHVVRLTEVRRDVDPLYGRAVVEIRWEQEDALPFPLCLSATGADCASLPEVSVARGNVILVDHGRPVRDEDLGCVPGECERGECECGRPGDVTHRPARFRPWLQERSLVHRQPLPRGRRSAEALTRQDPRKAGPALRLLAFAAPDCREGYAAPKEGERVPAECWWPQPTLLDSEAESRHFVAEVDDDRRTRLRFGDGDLGMQPAAATRFLATYRTGYGPAGNVGAEAISHIVYRRRRVDGIRLVRNPLPATGGLAPEPVSEAKLYAPHAFRRRLARAVLASDYAEIALRDFPEQVQRAHAELRPTGSGYEVWVAIDAKGGEAPAELLAAIEAHLAAYRRIGHDVVAQPAFSAGLVVELEVCVADEFLAGHVKAALVNAFSNRLLPSGKQGFFHPDRLTFGQALAVSDIVSEAHRTPGVVSVEVTGLRRVGDPHDASKADDALVTGALTLGPLEVGRLDNDPSQPANGRLVLNMRGGR